jgi:UDP-N-acetyl-2-amino-2-deoxyglucuronate dehydrogenase
VITGPIFFLEYEKNIKLKDIWIKNDMLKNEDLDLVALCTPSGVHAEQTELCAKHKLMLLQKSPWQLDGKMACVWLKLVIKLV